MKSYRYLNPVATNHDFTLPEKSVNELNLQNFDSPISRFHLKFVSIFRFSAFYSIILRVNIVL